MIGQVETAFKALVLFCQKSSFGSWGGGGGGGGGANAMRAKRDLYTFKIVLETWTTT